MSLFKSLPEEASLMDVLVRFPGNARALLTHVNAVMRTEGDLGIARKELIAAYISGLNACTFCFGVHRVFAEVFGIQDGLIEALVDDPQSAPIGDDMRPLLAYVRKLNALPSRLTTDDAKAVYDAGWSEEQLFEAIEVAALFNQMNRIVEGSGATLDFAAAPVAETVRAGGADGLQDSYLMTADRIEAST